MTQPGGCCGGRGASVAAAQAQQSPAAAAASNEKWKIQFSDGTASASTWPDKRSADIALARSPKAGKVVKA